MSNDQTKTIEAKDFRRSKNLVVCTECKKTVYYKISQVTANDSGTGLIFHIAEENTPKTRPNGKSFFYFNLNSEINVVEFTEHVLHTCDCQKAGCWTCEGGLFICDVCCLLEGSLTTQCPGVESFKEHNEAIYAGDLDYRDGAWHFGECSKHSPAYDHSENSFILDLSDNLPTKPQE